MPSSQAHALDAIVFAGYLAGLRAAGWHGDPALARLGYTSNIALIGLEFLAINLHGMHTGTPLAQVEQIFRHSYAAIETQHAAMFHFACELAQEAEALHE